MLLPLSLFALQPPLLAACRMYLEANESGCLYTSDKSHGIPKANTQRFLVLLLLLLRLPLLAVLLLAAASGVLLSSCCC